MAPGRLLHSPQTNYFDVILAFAIKNGWLSHPFLDTVDAAPEATTEPAKDEKDEDRASLL